MNKVIKIIISSACLLLLCSCMSKINSSEIDPYERYNRCTYKMNQKIDKALLKPLAKLYIKITPDGTRKATGNFFYNVSEISVIANDLLQFQFDYAWKDTWRFALNSTFGVFGLFDFADKIGLRRHYQDFGLTLAHWGIKKSPYLVVPMLGPSTMRDSSASTIDYYLFNPFTYLKPNYIISAYSAASFIHTRAELISTENVMDVAAIDPYIFIRDAYLQQRDALIRRNEGKSEEDAKTGSTTIDKGMDSLEEALKDIDAELETEANQ